MIFYGHLKGDEALRKIGQVLREQAEKYNGIAGRYGGDEFMLIFEQIDLARPEENCRCYYRCCAGS